MFAETHVQESERGVPVATVDHNRPVLPVPYSLKVPDQPIIPYIEGDGTRATHYPANPNGSTDSVAGVTTTDGRATILMPHPERTLRSANFSWRPDDWPDPSPWLRIFHNARNWVD